MPGSLPEVDGELRKSVFCEINDVKESDDAFEPKHCLHGKRRPYILHDVT